MARSSDKEVVVLLGQTVIVQTGVIAKCIEQLDAKDIYLEKVQKEIKKK